MKGWLLMFVTASDKRGILRIPSEGFLIFSEGFISSFIDFALRVLSLQGLRSSFSIPDTHAYKLYKYLRISVVRSHSGRHSGEVSQRQNHHTVTCSTTRWPG